MSWGELSELSELDELDELDELSELERMELDWKPGGINRVVGDYRPLLIDPGTP